MDKFKNITADFGYFLYDGQVKEHIDITAYPMEFACSRWTEDENGKEVIDPSTPIPTSPNGKLYRVGATSGVDFTTLEAAKEWANNQPWGPVFWNSDKL